VPRIFLAAGQRDRSFVEAIGRDQAAFRLEGRSGIDAFNPGVEQGRLRHLICPEQNKPPAALAHAMAAVFGGGDLDSNDWNISDP
jgi:hypothetical protein